MLRIHYSQLEKLKHNLDKVLIVVNEYQDASHGADEDYEDALSKFPDVLRVPNGNQGSYGALRDAFGVFPNYEWYFFLEDDYTFFLDNFDQLMIDMWTPETTYIAARIDGGGPYGLHASMPHGVTKGEVLKKIDWTGFNAMEGGEYNSLIQVTWSHLFGSQGLRDITGTYGSPFFITPGSFNNTDPSKPILIGPVQLI